MFNNNNGNGNRNKNYDLMADEDIGGSGDLDAFSLQNDESFHDTTQNTYPTVRRTSLEQVEIGGGLKNESERENI